MGSLGVNIPAAIVFVLSLVVGLAMVVVFRYTSDQKAIHVAKDRLKAHLLALRLFQDQIPVVMRSYARIVLATGRYLRLAFKPLLFVIVPITFLIVQVDRYLGFGPVPAGQTFLVKLTVSDAEASNEVTLQLPQGMAVTAPAVHVPSENEIAWRVVAEKAGNYILTIRASGQTFSKSLVAGSGLPRLSPARLRGRFWERIFISGERAIPENKLIDAIEVQYPIRTIAFAGFEWNWIWLFFVLSLVAGFLFKSILGIEI
ncbi:MAG TPA: hypothetical protein VGM18_15510 [Candidatus Sulfotelmatobacter sp.]|jgi:hypothetical protein